MRLMETIHTIDRLDITGTFEDTKGVVRSHNTMTEDTKGVVRSHNTMTEDIMVKGKGQKDHVGNTFESF